MASLQVFLVSRKRTRSLFKPIGLAPFGLASCRVRRLALAVSPDVIDVLDELRERTQPIKVVHDGATEQVAHGRICPIRPVACHWKRAAGRAAEDQHVFTGDAAGLQHLEAPSLEGVERVRDRHGGR